ncbi:hypothetical protein KRP22_011283 [Phytophthora ramorum]|nr:hypothetical protein KRP22_15253 [Phytophthora ramorum]
MSLQRRRSKLFSGDYTYRVTRHASLQRKRPRAGQKRYDFGTERRTARIAQATACGSFDKNVWEGGSRRVGSALLNLPPPPTCCRHRCRRYRRPPRASLIHTLTARHHERHSGHPHNDVRYFDSTWLQIGQDLRTQRWKNVVNIDRMLRNHRPHEVLTHVEQNTNCLARELPRREDPARARVAQVSRRLIGLRKRKNVAKFSARLPRQFLAMRQ